MTPQFTCISCGLEKPTSAAHIGRDRLCTICQPCWIEKLTQQFQRMCPPIYQKSDVSLLPEKELREVASWEYGPKGLLLMGETGRGKTRCAWLLVERLMKKEGIEVMAFDCISFSHELERRYRLADPVQDWMDVVTSAPVLFMDDLFKLKFTEKIKTELFALIERRCANELPIIATTQESGDSIVHKLSAFGDTDHHALGIVRRLRQFCRVIAF